MYLEAKSSALQSQVVLIKEWQQKWDAFAPNHRVLGPDGRLRAARFQVHLTRAQLTTIS